MKQINSLPDREFKEVIIRKLTEEKMNTKNILTKKKKI